MPKPGWSNETIIKPQILTEIGSLQFSIVERIHKKQRHGGLGPQFPFTYIDLTAGPGLHPDGTAGAAAVLHSMLRNYEFSSVMHLIEERHCDYRKLSSYFVAVDEDATVHCYHGKSEDIAPHLLGRLKYRPFGLICLDPNGCGIRQQALITAIARCDQTFRMDWLLHLPTRTIKRVRRCEDTQFKLNLLQLIALTGKGRGLVKRSPSGTKHDWLFIFLTNADTGTIRQWASQGWYDMASVAGREILNIANFTIDELQKESQGCLF